MTILFPSDYLNPRKPDPDYQEEYNAAQEVGFEVCLFHQQLWDRQREIKLSNSPEHSTCIYRGWMMKPEEYSEFYRNLKNEGVQPITSPEEYSNLHVYANSYPYVEKDSPRALFFDSVEDIDLEKIASEMDRFMVKDFVKSVKGTDFPVYFEHPGKEEFDKWMKKFVEYRGELLIGGICVKEFLNLAHYQENRTNEYRVFYTNGNVISVCQNTGLSSPYSGPPTELIGKYDNLDSPFYTVDFMECADGSWKVIETGDGGVSGLSEGQDSESFYRALRVCLETEKYNGLAEIFEERE